jgi:hypothetical protein
MKGCVSKGSAAAQFCACAFIGCSHNEVLFNIVAIPSAYAAGTL